MPPPRSSLGPPRFLGVGLLAITLGGFAAARGQADAPTPSPFAQFDLPDDWERRFWNDPNVNALLVLDPKALVQLIPVQAGLRYCRCPACDAEETDDPLAWAAAKPDVLTCRKCGVVLPNDSFPAKKDKDGKDAKDGKVPEESIEVFPGITHTYPYHAVAPEKQHYPEERLYLQAKRDYEAREFLSKAALYAAIRHRREGATLKSPRLARFACLLILRFAQVYPAYATHYDQPGQPKFFQQADLPPPYRRMYRTAKWDWSGSLNVPVNLVIAYALLRNDPMLDEAGRLLGDPHPARTIERNLFRASAEFVRLQPEEFNEMSLQAYRGLLAVGRLLDDPALVSEAMDRLKGFAERGFYHDGYWRQGDALAHRRVVGLIDAWIDRLLTGDAAAAKPRAEVPMLELAHQAEAAIVSDARFPEIQQTAWPIANPHAIPRHPILLGGTGLARLALGQGADAFDLELSGLGNFGSLRCSRQSLRLAIGNRSILGDLDDLPPTPTGWDRSSASHNTVVVDGLNQRESPARAREPAPGGSFLFFAADPDLQVVSLDDPRAYPQSTSRYRQTIVGVSGSRLRYALSVFEVHGGLQHDQFFHVAAGSKARWQLPGPLVAGPATLLPPSITYLPSARADEGRWFVQAYGELTPLGHLRTARPATATLLGPQVSGLRLHLLNEGPTTLVSAYGPDPALSPQGRSRDEETGRAVLIVRRQSENGASLRSTFVTLFEPLNETVGLQRVGRVDSPPGTVVVYLETAEGKEHVVVNLSPGTERTVALVDGRTLRTDGLVVRATSSNLVLAGGTFAETAEIRVVQARIAGTIRRAIRDRRSHSLGSFETDEVLPDAPSLPGRVLSIRHADGTARSWTIQQVEPTERGTRLFVREEPGFLIDERSGDARYYQFPRTSHPGPHHFQISRIAR